MNKLSKLLLTGFSVVAIYFHAGIAYASSDDSLCPKGTFSKLCDLKAEKAGSTVGTIVSILMILAIILTLLYLVYGGIKYITSGGDKAKIDAARSHLTAAVVGLVIALLSYFILNIVTFIFTGETFNSFQIPTLVSAP